MKQQKQQAEFIQWMPFVLDALRESGGSASPREVYDAVARLAKVPDQKRFAKLGGGAFRFPNQVAFARQYLVWEGLIASPKRGLWMLTPAGRNKRLSNDEARSIFLKWVAIWSARRKAASSSEKQPEPANASSPALPQPTPTEGDTTPEAYADGVLTYLQSLTSQEFERFCADFLRKLGMQIEVTGGKGDKGIDGEGYLPIGPLVRTKVAFQCKRYTGAVTPQEVREFQGAIGSRAEKGIFFTTGYFTDGATEAARNPMSKPVELIDGDRLVELLQEHEFGLKPMPSYEVDYTFLSNYKQITNKPKNSAPNP
jgi:restriction system protein